MEIKTEYEIVGEAKEKTDEELIRDYDKKWIALDDMIEYLKEFPAYHYSSQTINRTCADGNVQKIIKVLSGK